MPSACPMSGNVNNAMAPSARMAAIAKDASSSSASIAPCVAIIAETPQTDDPTASSALRFRFNPNRRPSHVMKVMASASSITTSTRLTLPISARSPTRKRAPSRTIPVLSQKSYVAIPARKTFGTPTVLATTTPMRIAQRTYSILGRCK